MWQELKGIFEQAERSVILKMKQWKLSYLRNRNKKVGEK